MKRILIAVLAAALLSACVTSDDPEAVSSDWGQMTWDESEWG